MKKQKCVLLLVLLVFIPLNLNAQYASGLTGLLNIPSAENREAGTIYVGGNFLPKDMLPPYFSNQYNTGNYFLTANVFSFFEISYRMTLIRDGQHKYRQQDRTFALRIQALREGKWRPGVAVGTQDPLADQGAPAYESYYAVVTKGVDLKGSVLSATLGYYFPFQRNYEKDNKIKNRGVFGGLSFSPSFYRDLAIMAEYDSHHFNVGASVKFLNCVRAHIFTQEFHNVCAGLRYECELWH